MNKKLIYGLIVPILAILVVGVSALLVGYLSNKVTADVGVSSPMEQWISYTGEFGWIQDGSLTLDSAYGGESITFYVMTENHADVSIEGNVKNIVENSKGVTCDDFVSVDATTTTDGIEMGTWDLIEFDLCEQGDDDYQVVFSFGLNPMTWIAEQIDITEVVVTFKTDAVGTYTFTSEIVPQIPA